MIGRTLRVELTGQSHGPGVGARIEGLPAGLPVDEAAVAARMAHRRPGHGLLVSARRERDRVELRAGVQDGQTTGGVIELWIRNEDARPQDYPRLPRPGHADWPAWTVGARTTGGGRHSGRLTAPLVAAAALAEPVLAAAGVTVGAHVHQVGALAGPAGVHGVAAMEAAMASPVHTAHADLAQAFQDAIEAARRARDSLGGVVAFCAEGLPVGLGGPLEDGVEARLAAAIFAVPAVKGLGIGEGFAAAAMRGSTHNDALEPHAGGVRTRTNHAGGLLGGLTTGAPLWGHVAIKPTSSIGVEQDTVDLDADPPAAARLRTAGRHDPCIAVRAAPVVRAAVALTLADILLGQPGHRGHGGQAS